MKNFFYEGKDRQLYKIIDDKVLNTTNANKLQSMILYEKFPNTEFRSLVKEREEFLKEFKCIAYGK